MQPEEIQQVFAECEVIFLEKAFDKHASPYACKIHDAFKTEKGTYHNCLGCNFADSTNLIAKYLEKNDQFDDIQQDFTVYIMLMYLLVERIDTVLDLVQVRQDYRDDKFKVFQRIRKWANFIKHPKSFILTHHPVYDFIDSGINYDAEFKTTIDDNFVGKFYKGSNEPEQQKRLNKELYEILSNNDKVRVLFPNIVKLTEQLCYAYNFFVDMILESRAYRDMLNNDATIIEYFENEESLSDSPSLKGTPAPAPLKGRK